MSHTATATLQTIWDCRWSRPGSREADGQQQPLWPETRWVCVREGKRRCITEEECENCPYWELAVDLWD